MFIPADTISLHVDVSTMLGVSIYVLNLALKWGQSINMGWVFYSTKWVKYDTLPCATTQNTTITHNNQNEPLPLYPPVALALSLRRLFGGATNSRCRCSISAHARLAVLGLLSPLLVPLSSFGPSYCTISEN
jgi:hypothetical protein